jgi:hypothetical protein
MASVPTAVATETVGVAGAVTRRVSVIEASRDSIGKRVNSNANKVGGAGVVTGMAIESITGKEKISEPTLENIYDCDCDTVSVNPYFVSQNSFSPPKTKNRNVKVSRLSSPFSISSSLPLHARNARFNDDTNLDVEKSVFKRVKNDNKNEKQSSFMKIEELTWQLSRAKHKLKYAGKHQNEPRSVNSEIKMIEESPIDHFYENEDYLETIILSKKPKNKFNFNDVDRSNENEVRSNMSYNENNSNATTINVQN